VAAKKDWERIRGARDDLTDYVIHFTKPRYNPHVSARDVLLEILQRGYIEPTFAPSPTNHWPTVKGPAPAVCLTEQPISAVLKTPRLTKERYSKYGIAYHKVPLYEMGGRPVLYASYQELGRRIPEGAPGSAAGAEVYTGRLPPELQYLWVGYEPAMPGSESYPTDFTWEREWRIRTDTSWFRPVGGGPPIPGLPILLPTDRTTTGAIIVENDEDVPLIRQCLNALAGAGEAWAGHLRRVVSLQTAQRQLDQGDRRYARLETWPDADRVR
jgi:hypothetical protein